MLSLKVLTLPQFVAVLFCLAENHRVYTTDLGDRFFGEPEPPYQFEEHPTAKNWFRVRQQESRHDIREGNYLQNPKRQSSGDGQRVAKSFESSSSDLDSMPEEAIPQVERYHESPSESTRNPRRYAPPVYSSDPRYPVNRNNDNNQCRCDLEYVLKYRGVYPGGDRPPGSYHVKVYHEETGHFNGDEKSEEPVYHSSRGNNNERNEKKYYSYPGSSPRSQQQRPAEYYVEEVADPVDRRGTYSRGNTKPVSSPIVRGGGEEERVVYKSRNPRAKSSQSFRKLVKLARAIVQMSNWATLSFSSSIESEFGGYPYTQMVRISDGTLRNSSGIPYLYLTHSVLEASFQSELEIPGVSLTISQHQSDDYGSCEDKRSGIWPCASVTLSGIIVPITSTEEIELAAESLMSRHTQKRFKTEGFLARMILKNIVIQHQLSGHVQMLPVNEYLD